MGIVIGSCVAQESAPNVTNTSSSRMLSPPRRQALIMSVMERRPDDQPEPVPINRFRSHSTFSLVSDLGSSFRGYQNSRIMYGTDWSPSKRSFPKQKPGSIEYPCHVMLSFPSPPLSPQSSPPPPPTRAIISIIHATNDAGRIIELVRPETVGSTFISSYRRNAS